MEWYSVCTGWTGVFVGGGRNTRVQVHPCGVQTVSHPSMEADPLYTLSLLEAGPLAGATGRKQKSDNAPSHFQSVNRSSINKTRIRFTERPRTFYFYRAGSGVVGGAEQRKQSESTTPQNPQPKIEVVLERRAARSRGPTKDHLCDVLRAATQPRHLDANLNHNHL